MATAKQTEPQGTAESGDRTSPIQRLPYELAGSAGGVLAGRYRLGALLGQGGMGEVWRAEHVVTGRPVAVKLLRDALAHRPDMRRRFLREARAAAAVNHPNVVEVLDAFEVDDGTPVLVMPLLEGETLAALIAREAPLSVAVALEVLLPLVSAVGAAHARGIVHRDLKPENVFLAKEGQHIKVKVLDFGIAKLMEANGTDNESLTGTGSLVGTPCYMAPEQGFGERDQDHRVDIWAIGVIAYESLSSCKPIEGENIAQVVRSLLTQGITPLEVVAPGLPTSLNDLVMSMLARARGDRPQTLREVHQALQLHAAQGTPAFVASFDADRSPVAHEETTLEDQQGFQFAPTLDVAQAASLPAGGALSSAAPRRWWLGLIALGLGFGLVLALRTVGGGHKPAARPVGAAPQPQAASSSLFRSALPAMSGVPSAQPTAPVVAAGASAAHRGAPPASVHRVAPAASAHLTVAGSGPAPAPSGSGFRGGLQEDPPF